MMPLFLPRTWLREVAPAAASSRRGQAIRLSSGSHVSMADAGSQSVEETSTRPGEILAAPVEAAKRHLAAVVAIQ
jgi:hypothetical protein